MLPFVTHINGTALRYVTLTYRRHHLALYCIAFVDFTLRYSKYVKSRHALLCCVTYVLLRYSAIHTIILMASSLTVLFDENSGNYEQETIGN